MTEPAAPTGADLPMWARVHLTSAVVQKLADDAGVDLLHLKGPSVHADLRSHPRLSSDVDVLVRPAHLPAMLDALSGHGWELYTDFDEGSSFGHAANYRHDYWSYVDVHRNFPGPSAAPARVFDTLWADRISQPIAARPCPVPNLPGQLLILALHQARSHHPGRLEAWELATPEIRLQATALAEQLGAQVPLSAVIGGLENYRHHPDHDLWAYWSGNDGDRLAEWLGRLQAARTGRERAQVLLRMGRVNRTHLRLRLGREPRRSEIALEELRRIGKGLRAIAGRVGGRLGGRR